MKPTKRKKKRVWYGWAYLENRHIQYRKFPRITQFQRQQWTRPKNLFKVRIEEVK